MAGIDRKTAAWHDREMRLLEMPGTHTTIPQGAAKKGLCYSNSQENKTSGQTLLFAPCLSSSIRLAI